MHEGERTGYREGWHQDCLEQDLSWVEVQRDITFDLPTVTVPEVPFLGMRLTALQVTGTGIEENYGGRDNRSRGQGLPV